MPLHLAPLSRRDFLQRSFVAGIGLFANPGLHATPSQADPRRWALFSDPHIAADPTTILRNVHLADHLRAAVAEVGTLPSPPAGIIINGDCALDRGLPEDYATFLELLKPLTVAGLPVHLTLGNHDDREIFWDTIKDAKSAALPVASKHLSVIESPHANWFLLDSLEVTKQTAGRLGELQRAWLARELDARADKPALIMVHHNPVGTQAENKSGLLDGPEFLELLIAKRQVKAVFYGHTHTWRQTEQNGLHLINLPAVAYPFNPAELTGWVDCRLNPDGATLDPRAHDPKHPQHGQIIELHWRPV